VLEEAQDRLRLRLTQQDLKQGADFTSSDGDYWILSGENKVAETAYLEATYADGEIVEEERGTVFYRRPSMLTLEGVKKHSESILLAFNRNLDALGDSLPRRDREEARSEDKPRVSAPYRPQPKPKQDATPSGPTPENIWLTTEVAPCEILSALAGNHNLSGPDVEQAVEIARDVLTKRKLRRVASLFPKDELPVEDFIYQARCSFDKTGFNGNHVVAHMLRFHGQIKVNAGKGTLQWTA